MKRLLSLSLLIALMLPFLQLSLHSQVMAPKDVPMLPRLGFQANLAGWISTQWFCSSRDHKMEITLLQPNAKPIPLDIPQKYLDSYGGLDGLERHFFYLAGSVRLRADGTWAFFVDEMAKDAVVSDPWQPQPFPQDRRQVQATQKKPFLVIPVKFKDITTETNPKAYYQGLMGNTYPGVRHYYLENSFKQLDITGTTVLDWVTLPQNKSAYITSSSFDYDKIVKDAAAVVDKSVDFRKYYGFAIMLNSDFSSKYWGWGGTSWLTLDGETRLYGTSMQAPPHHQSLCTHEMGHSLHLWHSSGPYSQVYDSQWDVMSGGRRNVDPTYGNIAPHTIAFHKERLGWIPQSRIYYAKPGTSQTVEIERLALPVSTTNYLMAQVFMGGLASKFYTVEFRQKVGYDKILPTSAPDSVVLIHSVDTHRAGNDRHAQVVDATNNGNCNDDGAIWLPGETFTDSAQGITIKINSFGKTSANITITNTSTGEAPEVVSNTNDSGAGSLRNALDYAYLLPNMQINFKIPKTDKNFSKGVATISLLTALPDLVQSGTVIDGFTQTSNVGDTNPDGPEIQISGASNGGGNGLRVYTSNNLFQGIAWVKFTNNALYFLGTYANNNRVQNCYFGIDPTGNAAAGNGWAVSLYNGARNNSIGDIGKGNVISGNSHVGVFVGGVGATGNIIRGNLIGTDRTGTKAVPNNWGVSLYEGSTKTTLDQNLISGNSSVGVGMYNSTGNMLSGNLLGTNQKGDDVVPNGWAVYLREGADQNTIGGTTASATNLISGNEVGIGFAGGNKNSIFKNYIGTDSTGKMALPNSVGVYVAKKGTAIPTGNIIGSSSTTGNLISGNDYAGILLEGAMGTTVRNNTIGLALDKTAPLGNASVGIQLSKGTTTSLVTGNTIAFNGIGIQVTDDTSLGNTFRLNSLFSQSGLGIDLSANDDENGVTQNDDKDADQGPNGLQNFPVITKATQSGTSYLYEGSLNSLPNTTFTIDLYGNRVLNASGFGEGRYTLGSVTVTTDSAGNATFKITSAKSYKYLVATATNKATGDTSEFSKVFTSP